MRPEFNDGSFKLVELPSMKGFSIGIKYFDDDTRVFVSPEVADKYEQGILGKLDFLTLSYRQNQKPIEEIITEIIEEIQLCGSGYATPDLLDELQSNRKIGDVAFTKGL